ncbi:nucleoside 2-deoxyribosyltransferase [Bombilactobacillus thymidiniphilus]|uniref:Nucleoside 2-deoxyribosyltransferase n=1 Tax=Bombilactobacillus thymidiniphilus TaxID=2923363 RepID=A0ABY4PCC7_9LACO|nr:nucleoside 2-deoxyribosyltransferase [Bombilactobacillus thymidiniphilus]UQS83420.1 nucleoside 2-deoxyribosyltransferase [Bombilactobacillus thymidiniphilus]
MTKQNTVYFACSWFSEEEQKYMEQGQKAISANPTVNWPDSYRPLDHQFKNIDVVKHPEALSDPLWQIGTFQNDITGIDKSDIICGLFLPHRADPGMSFEYGYAYATHKPIVSVIPDNSKAEINLMLIPSVTSYITISELATFDFNQLEYNIRPLTAY